MAALQQTARSGRACGNEQTHLLALRPGVQARLHLIPQCALCTPEQWISICCHFNGWHSPQTGGVRLGGHLLGLLSLLRRISQLHLPPRCLNLCLLCGQPLAPRNLALVWLALHFLSRNDRKSWKLSMMDNLQNEKTDTSKAFILHFAGSTVVQRCRLWSSPGRPAQPLCAVAYPHLQWAALPIAEHSLAASAGPRGHWPVAQAAAQPQRCPGRQLLETAAQAAPRACQRSRPHRLPSRALIGLTVLAAAELHPGRQAAALTLPPFPGSRSGNMQDETSAFATS